MSNRQYRHVQWLDLYGNGVEKEIVIIKEDNNGDKYFIQTESLDEIDLDRMRMILSKPSASMFPMWDLMSQTTLGNGMNALDYFHQIVRVKTTAGPIITPGKGRGSLTRNPGSLTQQPQAAERKGPGRPPKAAE